jgi:hypothetical protein
MGEAQRRQAGRRVGLVAEAVPRLLGRGAVVSQTVGLDHQSELGPVEVDLEAGHETAGLRQRQPGGIYNGQEPPLELGVGEPEGPPVEGPLEDPEAGTAPQLGERLPQIVGRDQVEPVSLVDGRLELPAGETGGEIDERGCGAADRDAVAAGQLLGIEIASMSNDAVTASPGSAGDGDLDPDWRRSDLP